MVSSGTENIQKKSNCRRRPNLTAISLGNGVKKMTRKEVSIYFWPSIVYLYL